ncbi:restriction endonuclease subunit S [Clostridium algidicarnis]|uniref:restriction endonuclease subunit S n=1 Tax=Clostridium algidicarnis TaxID=37659 RepID=UPI0016246CF8|nr:restriction endonuclease subunit S [Clostridium algidicarnis]MBB6698474.1 restriction endonuclease subunit S [Clostridium algidicarnis]
MEMKFKPYEEYKKVDLPWIDEIPSHWEMKKIKYIFSERNERGKEREPLLVASQRHGVILKSMYENRTVEALRNLESLKYVNVGDFVISLRSFQGGVEYAYYSGIISPAYTIMIPKGEVVRRYFKYLAKSYNFIKLLQTCVTGIREGQNIDYNKLRDQKIFLPPKEEQDKIADFLDHNLSKIDKFIELTERQIELLKEQKEVIINDAVTKGIDKDVEYKDSGIDWIGEIPAHWEVTRVKYISKILNGGTPNSSISEFWNGDIFWVTPKDLSKVSKYIYSSDRKITKEGYKNCSTSLIPKNNIIMATRAPIGNIKINKIETTINQGCKAILVDKNLIDLNYLYFLLNDYLEELQLLGNGATFVELSTSNLSQFKINIPPKKEQKEIVSYIEKETSKIDRTIELYKSQIELIKEYRTSLIASAVTGKIDVRDF